MDKKITTRDSQPVAPHHSIRLRHPWQSESREGSTFWSRKFNWPSEPDAGERILLVVEAVPASATVTLNENELGTAAQAPFDVTEQIAVHNRVVMVLPSSEAEPADQFPYEVRLEIFAADAIEE